MRVTFSLCLLFCLFADREMQSQDPDISGTWTIEFRDGMIHLKRSTPDGSAYGVNSFKLK